MSEPQPGAPERIPASVFLGLVLGLGAAIRFVDLSASSFWHDEAYTALLIPNSFTDIALRTARDVHPPLYYWILKVWSGVFGADEFGLRSLSVVLSLGTMVIVYLLALRLWDEKVARLGAVFLAVGPFFVRFAQEARMYALVAFWLICATYLLVRAVQGGSWKNWLGYAVLVCAALYTHYFAVFGVVAHGVYLGVEARRQPRLWVGWLAACAGAAFGFLPWLPLAWAQFTRVQDKFWIMPVGAHTLTNSFSQLFFFCDGDFLPLPVWLVIGSAGLVWLSTALRAERERLSAYVLLLAYTFAGPLLVFLLSFKRSIYTERCFLYAAAGFYLLLAVLCVKAWVPKNKTSMRVTLVLCILILFVPGNANRITQTRHPARAFVAEVASQFKPGDALVADEIYSYLDFQYYNKTGTELKLFAPKGLSGIEETSLFYERDAQIAVRDLRELQPSTGVVWIIGKSGERARSIELPVTWHAEGSAITLDPCRAVKYRIQRLQ